MEESLNFIFVHILAVAIFVVNLPERDGYILIWGFVLGDPPYV